MIIVQLYLVTCITLFVTLLLAMIARRMNPFLKSSWIIEIEESAWFIEHGISSERKKDKSGS